MAGAGLQRELLALGRSLDFVPKTMGTNKGFKPGGAGSDLHFRNSTDSVII